MTPTLDKLIEALALLPGIGRRTAQRMSMHMLQRDRPAMATLARALQEADSKIGLCERCRTFSETPCCSVCNDPGRDTGTLCVLESPADQVAIEEQGNYRGRYFVLHGYLSPLDNIGPDQLGLDQLAQMCNGLDEVILATNATVEGEATACYLADMLTPRQIKVTRIASGIPMGGEIEYLDGGTLARAIEGRRPVEF